MQAIFSYLQHQRVSPPCRLISVFFLPMLSWNISLCSRELLSLLFLSNCGPICLLRSTSAPPLQHPMGGICHHLATLSPPKIPFLQLRFYRDLLSASRQLPGGRSKRKLEKTRLFGFCRKSPQPIRFQPAKKFSLRLFTSLLQRDGSYFLCFFEKFAKL